MILWDKIFCQQITHVFIILVYFLVFFPFIHAIVILRNHIHFPIAVFCSQIFKITIILHKWTTSRSRDIQATNNEKKTQAGICYVWQLDLTINSLTILKLKTIHQDRGCSVITSYLNILQLYLKNFSFKRLINDHITCGRHLLKHFNIPECIYHFSLGFYWHFFFVRKMRKKDLKCIIAVFMFFVLNCWIAKLTSLLEFLVWWLDDMLDISWNIR